MASKSCIRRYMQSGFTAAEAQSKCGMLYESKTTPGIRYQSVVPGIRTTPGRIEYEEQLKGRKARRGRGRTSRG